MKNNLSLICENRLKQVLTIDKQINSSLIQVLKSDILHVLKNYMEINAEELDLNISIDEFGFYDISVCAKVRRLITFSRIPD